MLRWGTFTDEAELLELPLDGSLGEPDPDRQRFHRRLLIGGGVLVAAALLAVVTLDRATSRYRTPRASVP